MKYSLTSLPQKYKNTFFCCGVFDQTNLDELNRQLGLEISYLKDILSNIDEEFTWISTYHQNNHYFFINCGEQKNFDSKKLKTVIKKITNFLLEKKADTAVIKIPKIDNLSENSQIEKIILQIEEESYQFLDLKTQNKKFYKLKSVMFNFEKASESSIKNAVAIAEGIKLTRNLGNLPANICTPSHLAEVALNLDKEFGNIHTKILNEEQLQKKGMHALLAVAKGSEEYAKLIEINYKGTTDNIKPIVLVGKGITFDSGGISLKPPAGMEEMKYDMCGAASVLGTIKAIAEMQLPINVIGVLACAENMPGSNAVKPGDVVKSYSGQTIEITNTDAEGRLVLADALTYVEKFNPKFVIDIATLTGAVVIALGHNITGLMTNDDELAKSILKAAEVSEDNTWRLPIDEKISDLLNSTVADMLNSPSERIAGTIVAASFLARFTNKYSWAHLDIAGTAWISGKNRTATGRPVPLLVELLREITNAS